MPAYVIRFNGHISWEGQANGLPKVIHAFLMFDSYDKPVFIDAINSQTAAFITARGMTVQREQGQIIDINQMPQERIYVPMAWIVTIDVDVFPLTGEMSNADDDGTELLVDGSEPVKQ